MFFLLVTAEIFHFLVLLMVGFLFFRTFSFWKLPTLNISRQFSPKTTSFKLSVKALSRSTHKKSLSCAQKKPSLESLLIAAITTLALTSVRHKACFLGMFFWLARNLSHNVWIWGWGSLGRRTSQLPESYTVKRRQYSPWLQWAVAANYKNRWCKEDHVFVIDHEFRDKMLSKHSLLVIQQLLYPVKTLLHYTNSSDCKHTLKPNK